MKVLFNILLLISLFAIYSCGESNSSNEISFGSNQESEKTKSVSTYDSPCDLFNDTDIRSLFSVPTEIEITMKDVVLTHPTCKFEWEDKKVQRVTKVGSMEVTTEMPSETMIVMASKVNESMYERSVSVYKDGVEVENIGDRAMWGEKMAQLSFLSGGMLFHIHVKADNDDSVNKAKAIEIAKTIISRM
ncbi:MAG: hypothetical protein EP333_08900 [Bacteroidetes bacterium]|nr:MAG: hypothetical protein EP333_08900 [Bacteroidota bacterium]TNF00156.1 MAG: hypothetical protein EP322_01885 [Bacteroidota bacterium]